MLKVKYKNMKAKFINESFNELSLEDKAEEIETAVYTTYNGDDVDYDINDEDIVKLENLLDVIVNRSDIEELGDMEWTLANLREDDIIEIYRRLVEHGFIIE